jgi:hypothetical protein
MPFFVVVIFGSTYIATDILSFHMQGWSVIIQMRNSGLDLLSAYPFVLFNNVISLVSSNQSAETEVLDVLVHDFHVR